jgi:hypothetical protein
MKKSSSFYFVILFAVIIVILIFSPEISSYFSDGKEDTRVKQITSEKEKKVSKQISKEPEANGAAGDLYIPSEQDDEIPESDSFNQLLDRIESGEFKLETDESEIVDRDFDDKKKRSIQEFEKKLESFSDNFNNLNQAVNSNKQLRMPFSDPPLSPEKQEERKQIIKILSKEELTWQDLNNPLIIQPVDKAMNEGAALIKALDPRYSRTKFALLNYLKGLEILKTPNNTLITPKEAIDYIGSLDIKVTQSFIEERIGRTEYLIWRAISLTPFIEAAGGINSVDYIPPFKTDIIVTELNITNNLVSKPKGGKYRMWLIKVKGLIEGREANKLQIYHGRNLIQLIDLPSAPGDIASKSYRNFSFSFNDNIGSRPYTIRALGENGSYFQKSYSFISLPMKSFQRDANGNPIIPNITNLNINQPPSKALDEKILIGIRSNYWNQSGKAGDGVMQFSTFDTRIGRLRNF